MKQIAFLSFIFVVFIALPVLAGGSRVITLKDGSKVNGRIIGIDNGHYVIETESLSKIKVKEKDVDSIEDPAESPVVSGPTAESTTPATHPYAGHGQTMRTNIINDPAEIIAIRMLAQDPEIIGIMENPSIIAAAKSGNISNLSPDDQALAKDEQLVDVLSDPAILAAVKSNNTSALLSNPKIQEIMHHPRIQAFVEKIRSHQQQP